MAESLIERHLRSYRMVVRDAQSTPLRNQRALWEELATLPFDAKAAEAARVPPGRVRIVQDSQKWMAAKVSLGKGAARHTWGHFTRVQYDNLPAYRDRQEAMFTLPLPTDAGIDYAAHFGWWDYSHCLPGPKLTRPERVGLLLMEVAHGSPSHAALQLYLNEKFAPRWTVEITEIIEESAWNRLRAAGEFKAINVVVGRSKEEEVEDGPLVEMFRGFQAVFGAAPTHTASVTLRFERPRGERYNFLMCEEYLQQLEQLDEVEKVSVEVGGKGKDIIDLANPKTRITVKVERAAQSARYADPQSIHREIDHAHRDKREFFAGLLGLRWVDPPDGP